MAMLFHMSKKLIVYIVCFVQVNILTAQISRDISIDSTQEKVKGNYKDFKNNKNLAKIEDYLKISVDHDTTYVDTTLSIKKLYKFNYLRKDNFNLISFSNLGQTYNTLSVNFSEIHTVPEFGARARHFNYFEIEDIFYYRVPTPLTELFYKTAFQQGQLLDAFFTINTSDRFNFSVAYKGLRSLGNYQNILTSTGNFRVTSNYRSKNNRYKARGHIVTQDLLNNENGGLSDEDIGNFTSGEEEFKDRSVFDPNFQNAQNILVGKRFLLDHQYALKKRIDSTASTYVDIGNRIIFEDKFYRFEQVTAASPFFGESFNTAIYDKVTLEDFTLTSYARFGLKNLGQIQGTVDYRNINYGYNTLVNLGGQVLTNRIKNDFFRIGGSYINRIGDFDVNGKFSINLSDKIKGNFIEANASFRFNEETKITASLIQQSSLPNYNFLLYQSDYLNYNWDNLDSFNNQNKLFLGLKVESEKFLNVSVDITNIDNYTYFSKNSDQGVKPFQSNDPLRYARVRLSKELALGQFALDNTIMYQNILEGEGVFNVPEFISRNTLYYQNHLFKKALYLQTGITFNYFTEYNMNAYDPLLAEFYVQNDIKLGSFPRLDFFVNAKIRQTRLFFIAEHFNSSFTGYDYFSAPNYPYRDFTIRFGLVWDFFL